MSELLIFRQDDSPQSDASALLRRHIVQAIRGDSQALHLAEPIVVTAWNREGVWVENDGRNLILRPDGSIEEVDLIERATLQMSSFNGRRMRWESGRLVQIAGSADEKQHFVDKRLARRLKEMRRQAAADASAKGGPDWLGGSSAKFIRDSGT